MNTQNEDVLFHHIQNYSGNGGNTDSDRKSQKDPTTGPAAVEAAAESPVVLRRRGEPGEPPRPPSAPKGRGDPAAAPCLGRGGPGAAPWHQPEEPPAGVNH